jgi:hypothetical protein
VLLLLRVSACSACFRGVFGFSFSFFAFKLCAC